ncbi:MULTISPECIES: flagellar protein FlhE [unclassified Halomonas]|uniref:flagellar protein FlhE n=1 Tax=unclassified Halomonas TaxID=2609666 RepID=UPI0021E448A1|nr:MULTISPECIES: flagellar protein FlhE [unclassified Halomonas]UYG00087.1 flagellar protein FlhE [Halomonas sp. GD1P12]WNL42163.1 flagellar protein FlhE [Halomonas sp. PAMB 3264]
MRNVILAALSGVVASGLSLSALAGGGSWSVDTTGLMVAMSDRASASQALAPPPSAEIHQGRIERVNWRFEAPPGADIHAWLCHPERCVALDGQRGSATGLAGLNAGAPLEFRFALGRGQPPVRVRGLQVIVNYQ